MKYAITFIYFSLVLILCCDRDSQKNIELNDMLNACKIDKEKLLKENADQSQLIDSIKRSWNKMGSDTLKFNEKKSELEVAKDNFSTLLSDNYDLTKNKIDFEIKDVKVGNKTYHQLFITVYKEDCKTKLNTYNLKKNGDKISFKVTNNTISFGAYNYTTPKSFIYDSQSKFYFGKANVSGGGDEFIFIGEEDDRGGVVGNGINDMVLHKLSNYTYTFILEDVSLSEYKPYLYFNISPNQKNMKKTQPGAEDNCSMKLLTHYWNNSQFNPIVANDACIKFSKYIPVCN